MYALRRLYIEVYLETNLLCPNMAKLLVMQPPKTINRWRLQIDPKVMDLGDPCRFTDGEPNQYICILVLAPLIPTTEIQASYQPGT